MKIALLTIGAVGSILAGVVVAQQKPVAAMFGDDQKRGETIALSFATAEIARPRRPDSPCISISPQVTSCARSTGLIFDPTRRSCRPIPICCTTGAWPATQRVLMERVRKQSTVMRDLEEQIAARKKQSPATSDGLLSIGVDTFVALLPRPGRAQASGAFPKTRVSGCHRLCQRRRDRSSRAVRAGPCTERDRRLPDGTRCRRRSVARPATHGRGHRPARSRKTPHSKANACSKSVVS